jgi:hypothetical protein
MRRRHWWTAGAALAAAGAITAAVLVGDGGGRPSPGVGTGLGALNPPPVETASPQPSSPTTPAPTPRLDRVAAAVPTTFVMKGPKFRIKAHVCSMPFVRPLDPPGEQHHTVCWVDSSLGENFGVAPGYPSRGTSYVLGHSWAEDPDEVLNPMSELAMRQVRLTHPTRSEGVPIYPVTNLDGYTITLTTPHGRLTYQVTRAFAVSKARAGDLRSVMAQHTPNRLVLITCGVRNGRDVDVNVIAYASLIRAVATPVVS